MSKAEQQEVASLFEKLLDKRERERDNQITALSRASEKALGKPLPFFICLFSCVGPGGVLRRRSHEKARLGFREKKEEGKQGFFALSRSFSQFRLPSHAPLGPSQGQPVRR